MGIKFGAHLSGLGSDLLQAQNEPSAIQFVIAVIGIVVGTMGSGLRLLAGGNERVPGSRDRKLP
jgi:hypothetical protein